MSNNNNNKWTGRGEVDRDSKQQGGREREQGGGKGPVAADLVEAGDHVRHVHPRQAILVHSMEHVVTEQLQHVAISRLRPGRIHAEPGLQKNPKKDNPWL